MSNWQTGTTTDANVLPLMTATEQPVLFLGAGPGLSVAYAADNLALDGAEASWTFFEQPGCGSAPGGETVTARATVEAAVGFLDGIASPAPVSVVAHSWGAYLALELLARLPESIGRLALLNPVPPTKAGFDEAAMALQARLKPAVRAQVDALLARGDASAGRGVMRLMLPAYRGRSDTTSGIGFDLTISTYHSVLGTLDAYDHRRLLAEHRDRITLAFGETDYITPDLYARHLYEDLGSYRTEMLQGGHFGFLDDPRLAEVLRGAAI